MLAVVTDVNAVDGAVDVVIGRDQVFDDVNQFIAFKPRIAKTEGRLAGGVANTEAQSAADIKAGPGEGRGEGSVLIGRFGIHAVGMGSRRQADESRSLGQGLEHAHRSVSFMLCPKRRKTTRTRCRTTPACRQSTSDSRILKKILFNLLGCFEQHCGGYATKYAHRRRRRFGG
jgi:hypothetical protein